MGGVDMEIKKGHTLSQFIKLIKSTMSIYEEDQANGYFKIADYDEYCDRPLTIGQFIPCDLEGNKLSKPETVGYIGRVSELANKLNKWKEAESRVIFKGVKSKGSSFKLNNWVIQFGSNEILVSYETAGSIGSTKQLLILVKSTANLFQEKNLLNK